MEGTITRPGSVVPLHLAYVSFTLYIIPQRHTPLNHTLLIITRLFLVLITLLSHLRVTTLPLLYPLPRYQLMGDLYRHRLVIVRKGTVSIRQARPLSHAPLNVVQLVVQFLLAWILWGINEEYNTRM